MAQTLGAVPVAAAYSAVSVNGTDWTSLGPAKISETPGGGEFATGATNTQDGPAPVVTGSGKHGAHTHEITNLYTEVSAEAVDLVRDAANSEDPRIYFRYAPKGNTPGNIMYTAANNAGTAYKAWIKRALPPASDANSGDAARFTFLLEFPKYAESVIST